MVCEAYSQSIWKTGGIPVLLTYPGDDSKVSNLTDYLDGLILTGGPDLPIELYGGMPYNMKGEDPMSPERFSFDSTIFEAFANINKPILAVCAGLQIINVINGGTLYEDIPSQLNGALDHGDYKGPPIKHAVDIIQSSNLGDVLGVKTHIVKSIHHQGIRNIGHHLKPVAYAPDGLIEAVEPANWEVSFIAVQWHPEQMQDDKIQMKLFRWLLELASR